MKPRFPYALPPILLWIGAALLVGCGSEDSLDSAGTPTDISIEGVWRAELTRYDGEDQHPHPMAFAFEVVRSAEGALQAWAINGEERVEFTDVSESSAAGREGSGNSSRTVRLGMKVYDSEITAEVDQDGRAMVGEWRKTAADGDSRMKFRAELVDSSAENAPRFSSMTERELVAAEPDADFSGVWTATFVDEDGEFPARGIFEQQGRSLIGTFRTTTGDYRYLDGEVVTVDGRDELRLSAFDGAHAFLFHARYTNRETSEIAGDFWSRDQYHATFTARPARSEDELPNGFDQVGLTNDDGRFSFSFPTPEGEVLSSSDPRFQGKVVLVEIFGTWCPNCNDSAPYLASLYQRYHQQGLEMVGLAYEMKGDFERDARFVELFKERHQVPYPLLVAGTSDKEEAAQTLPDLEAVLSFPTKVFLDRSGKVREIYSGYDGPSTGTAHSKMKTSMEELIEKLLAEPAS